MSLYKDGELSLDTISLQVFSISEFGFLSKFLLYQP